MVQQLANGIQRSTPAVKTAVDKVTRAKKAASANVLAAGASAAVAEQRAAEEEQKKRAAKQMLSKAGRDAFSLDWSAAGHTTTIAHADDSDLKTFWESCAELTEPLILSSSKSIAEAVSIKEDALD